MERSTGTTESGNVSQGVCAFFFWLFFEFIFFFEHIFAFLTTSVIALVMANVNIFILLFFIMVMIREVHHEMLRLKLREALQGPQQRVVRTAPRWGDSQVRVRENVAAQERGARVRTPTVKPDDRERYAAELERLAREHELAARAAMARAQRLRHPAADRRIAAS